ncbi:alpha-galactosidase [Allostreptomyces psammosilenae]|uniref:alpha-galactosidase n=1 Tax=Allostreptomyces psammosilenae TaxID=1892865 RepID=A0A853A8M9_9ACTN|nr:alpha-galactosidase [Allostreptomyces psammosilenae]NYI06991.1 alpha-galactosidase [Allostreptomyces psammosilenae]
MPTRPATATAASLPAPATIQAPRPHRLWLLSTTNTSYVVQLTDDGRLVQVYWGPRLTSAQATGAADDHSPPGDRAADAPADADEQLPVDGGPRWGVPSLQVTCPGQVRSLELEFLSDTVHPEPEIDAVRLDLTLADRYFPLTVTLHYRLRHDSDAVERWVTLRHTGPRSVPSARAAAVPRPSLGTTGTSWSGAAAGSGGATGPGPAAAPGPAAGPGGAGGAGAAGTDEAFWIHRADSANWVLPELGDYRLTGAGGAWAAETLPRRAPLPFGETTLTSRQGITGHSANPWLMLDDGTATESHGTVWSWALAWSGSWRLTASRRAEVPGVAVTGGAGHDGVTWRLGPGEELTTPPMLGLYSPEGFGGTSRAWHRHIRRHVLPQPDELRPVAYHSWAATRFDADESGRRELARRAARLGAELFVLGDGWFGNRGGEESGLGDWWPNPKRFPNGLRPLSDTVHDLGMLFGLWVGPEMVNPDSELYRSRPDWVLHHPHRRRDARRHRLVLNFARPDVREWALGWLDELVDRADVDLLQWDLDRPFSQAGWPERGGRDGDQDRLWLDHVRGVYGVLDELRARHPRLRVQSRAAGGGRVDLGVLRRADEVWTSDNTDAFHRQAIQHGFGQLYPAVVMAASVTDRPNAVTGRAVPLRYRFHVAMAGALGVGGDLPSWSAEEIAEATALVAEYKEIRPAVQLGEQYRLGAEPGAGLSGVQYRYEDEVVVLAYLPHPGPGVPPLAVPAALRLADLEPDAVYENVRTGRRHHGRVLMAAGLPLPRFREARGDYVSEVVRLRRI